MLTKTPKTNSSEFANKVKAIVRNIKAGTTLSYRRVAELAGHPKAIRAVATVLAKNFDPSVPCHRVIHSDGRVGEYNRGGSEAKLKLLTEEGWIQP